MAKDPTMPSVLFLCVHNAGRSQMAAGFLHHKAGDKINVLSAGSTPAESVNLLAVSAMSERGIDIARATPKRWTDDMIKSVDVVITMGCGDTCPVFPGRRYLDWDVDDPSDMEIEGVRRVRDDIEDRVEALIAELVPL